MPEGIEPTIGGYIKSRFIEPVKESYGLIKAGMGGRIEPFIGGRPNPLMQKAAFEAASMVTLPSIGAKPAATVARMGFSGAQKKVMSQVDDRIADLGKRLEKAKLKAPTVEGVPEMTSKQLELITKQNTALAAREAFQEGFDAMPRVITRPAKEVRALSQKEADIIYRGKKGRKRAPHGFFQRKERRAVMNIDNPVERVIGHEFLHSVSEHLRQQPAKAMHGKSIRMRQMYGKTKVLDALETKLRAIHTKTPKRRGAKPRDTRTKPWQQPWEWVETKLGEDFIKEFRKTGKRMDTREAAKRFEYYQDQYLKVLRNRGRRGDLVDAATQEVMESVRPKMGKPFERRPRTFKLQT